jgi:hypothetical protein
MRDGEADLTGQVIATYFHVRLLGISGALYLGIFGQPAERGLFHQPDMIDGVPFFLLFL